MNAGQRADGAAQTHDHLVRPRGRQDTLQPLPDLRAQRLERARLGPIVAEETAGGPHGAEWQARRGDDLPIAYPAQLQAGAAQIRDDAVPEGQAVQRGFDAEPRLVAGAQDLHLDALVTAQGLE